MPDPNITYKIYKHPNWFCFFIGFVVGAGTVLVLMTLLLNFDLMEF